MNKKRGFVLIEAIFMIVFISVALLLVYKAFSTSFQDEKKRVNYDNTETIYKTYFLKQYFEENGLLNYLTTVTLNNGYLEISCSTLTSVNNEYCSFLTSVTNLNVTKMYITKLDMSGINYVSLDATTIDYMKTLSSKDASSYRFIVWYGDNKYASLKIGDPFYNLRVYLDGGTWDGISPQKLINGDTTNITEPSKEGFAFDGWNVVGSGASVNGTTFTMGTEDTSLIATWRLPNYTFTYTGSYQTLTVSTSGYYNVQLWGASGGEALYTSNYNGGNGGYTSGLTYLTKGEVLYIYVGGKGQTVTGTTTGTLTANGNGYNGGGYGSFYANNSAHGGGGGATDIRFFGSTTPTTSDLLWSSTLGLNSRIMVAAGGGGGNSHASTPSYSGTGGKGGGIIGMPAISGSATCYAYGMGGTQIAGGVSTTCATDGHAYAGTGYFGSGGGPYTSYTATSGEFSGGGSGYYGGASGYHAAAGGGSSFISGYAGVNAITSASSRAATNNTIHYSGKYFINGNMLTGVNSGNGMAKLDYIGTTAQTKVNTNLNNVRYIKDCINGNNANGQVAGANHWVELQAIYNGLNLAKSKTVTGTAAQNTTYPYSRIVDGDITSTNYSQTDTAGLQCITVDLGQTYNLDEIAVWHYWADGRTYYSNTTYASSDNSTWTIIIANTEPETSQGKRASAYYINYNYTGSVQTFTVPYTGNYKLEVWGAQGGFYSTSYIGGYGGYSSGDIYFEKDSVISIYVGGQGITGSTNLNGGYNGGGPIVNCNITTNGSGGGATHIATTSGLLNLLSSNQGAILIVAGGGGGGGYWSGGAYGAGGAGGGMNGVNGQSVYGSNVYYGTGGTQISAGYYNYTPSAGIGSFGQGGTTQYGGGGGSGYYGGGGCANTGGGGGGSGYIGNSSLTNKAMYCYNCTTSSNASTLTYSTTNVSGAATSNYAKSGHGAAKITYLGS